MLYLPRREEEEGSICYQRREGMLYLLSRGRRRRATAYLIPINNI
jgi:hypothetical protein